MVPMPPAAPVNTIFLASAILLSSCKGTVAVERACEMLAHGPSGLGGIAVGNCRDDARMFVLDALQIGPPLGRRVDAEPYALPRNHMAAEIGKEARKLAVASGLGNGAMEGKILSDGTLAALQRR